MAVLDSSSIPEHYFLFGIIGIASMRKSISEKIKALKTTNKNKLQLLLEECRESAHRYFDENIRALPKDELGNFIYNKQTRNEFYDNDVDAFRHAYVSGVLTQKYGESIANIMGQAKEFEAKAIRKRNRILINVDFMKSLLLGAL